MKKKELQTLSIDVCTVDSYSKDIVPKYMMKRGKELADGLCRYHLPFLRGNDIKHHETILPLT